MPHKILSSLLDKIQNTKKLNTRESKERTFEKKVREWVVLILIYFNAVEEDRWKKLNEMFVFGLFLHLVCLTAATFMKWFAFFKNTLITFGW